MGDMIWVEVDLEMDASLTIAEGHAIAEEARKRVMQHEPVLDVMTHFDPVWPRRGPASGPGREGGETAQLPQPGRHSD